MPHIGALILSLALPTSRPCTGFWLCGLAPVTGALGAVKGAEGKFGFFPIPLSPLLLAESLPLALIFSFCVLFIFNWRAVVVRVVCCFGSSEVISCCTEGPSSCCVVRSAVIGGGPWPIVISDSSQLWRQCNIIMLRCVSWVAFSETLSLLASIGSCTAVWTIVGRLCSWEISLASPLSSPPGGRGVVAAVLIYVRPSNLSVITSRRSVSFTFVPGAALWGASWSASHPAPASEKDLQVWFLVEPILCSCAICLYDVATGQDVQLH